LIHFYKRNLYLFDRFSTNYLSSISHGRVCGAEDGGDAGGG